MRGIGQEVRTASVAAEPMRRRHEPAGLARQYAATTQARRRADVADGKRVSHDDLMAAQEALGRARDSEFAAGNTAVGRAINELAIVVFKVALQAGLDAELEAMGRG